LKYFDPGVQSCAAERDAFRLERAIRVDRYVLSKAHND
jgi:hypothetical protein